MYTYTLTHLYVNRIPQLLVLVTYAQRIAVTDVNVLVGCEVGAGLDYLRNYAKRERRVYVEGQLVMLDDA
jgi:hypothetical protein